MFNQYSRIGPVYAAGILAEITLSIAFQMKANWLNMPVYIGDRTNQVTLSMKILLYQTRQSLSPLLSS